MRSVSHGRLPQSDLSTPKYQRDVADVISSVAARPSS